MPRVLLILLVLAFSACTSSPLAPSPAPALSNAPTNSAAAPASSTTSAPLASGACIDTGELADNGETVMTSIQGVISALKAAKADQARTAAATASSGLKKLADFVDPAQPEAAKDFRTAASELDSAATKIPGSLPVVEQAQTDATNGLLLARAAECP